MGPALAAQAVPAAATTPSSTDYKIGVVDMDEVLKQYNKLKTQLAALEAETSKLQKDLNAKADALAKKIDGLKSAPEAERELHGDELRSEYRNIMADKQRMQGELDDKVARLRVRTRQDIIKAIQEIGAAENYHLILEGDADGRSTIIYFAGPMNITGKVIEKLNGGAAPVAAAPAAPKK
jgi:Skp family chaperone for outer membrane proteins